MVIKEDIKNFPNQPGVYLMKSKGGSVLYIGKAINLRKRVSSYFSRQQSQKTNTLLSKADKIEYIISGSEEQALILEAALIKEKKPKYNVALRDDKSYPCLKISQEEFPRVYISRFHYKNKDLTFGPYPRAKTLKAALALIRKIFPYRTCKKMSKKACLFFHLNLCPAPCIKKVNSLDYKAYIDSLSQILKGERKRLIKNLESRMNKLARQKKFEAAARIRNRISALKSLYSGRPQEHELISLKDNLGLRQMPLIIEAIDISSLGGDACCGSVVVFKDAYPDKKSYRRFSIKNSYRKDDYDMVGEVVRRRYSRLLKEGSEFPDLIVIDGGKGHVTRAHEELKRLGIDTFLIGIAKRNEEIWFPLRDKPLLISHDKPCLHLIQRVRDEAHRFAKAYHKLLRRKNLNK